MQSNYLCYFTCKAQKIFILTIFTWLLILDKIEGGSQESDHVWWHHRPLAEPPPIKYTSSCRKDQRLSTEGKIVSKYCNIKNSRGVHPPPPCTTGGVWLRVRPRVNKLFWYAICNNWSPSKILVQTISYNR